MEKPSRLKPSATLKKGTLSKSTQPRAENRRAGSTWNYDSGQDYDISSLLVAIDKLQQDNQQKGAKLAKMKADNWRSDAVLEENNKNENREYERLAEKARENDLLDRAIDKKKKLVKHLTEHEKLLKESLVAILSTRNQMQDLERRSSDLQTSLQAHMAAFRAHFGELGQIIPGLFGNVSYNHF